ncbi:hypothetical protein JBE27_41825, partial [Streptomyces albiflaviniger]|nr:hypothetical protein [Streptomyces albiflaviniger]
RGGEQPAAGGTTAGNPLAPHAALGTNEKGFDVVPRHDIHLNIEVRAIHTQGQRQMPPHPPTGQLDIARLDGLMDLRMVRNSGRADGRVERPRHAYTRALLDAVPGASGRDLGA